MTLTGYRSRKIVIPPSLNMRREYKVCGALVRVISGAWGAWKICFDAPPASEANADDQSSRLVNGECFSSSTGPTFQSFWITTSTLQAGTSENLILEVFECAEPVVVLNNQRGAGWRYHNLGGAVVVAEITAGNNAVLYSDSAWGATGAIDDSTAVEYIARRFVGGGIQADGPFDAYVMAYLNKNGTKLGQHAKLTATATSVDGQYSVTFENPELAWPMFGLKLYLVAKGTPDIENYVWNLYSRTP